MNGSAASNSLACDVGGARNATAPPGSLAAIARIYGRCQMTSPMPCFTWMTAVGVTSIPVAQSVSTRRVHRLARHDEIDAPVEQCAQALLRPVHDWLLVHIEACVHQHRQSGRGAEAPQDIRIERVVLVAKNLRACRAVDMHDGWDFLAPLGAYRAGD